MRAPDGQRTSIQKEQEIDGHLIPQDECLLMLISLWQVYFPIEGSLGRDLCEHRVISDNLPLLEYV